MNETAQVALAVTIIMLVFNFIGPIINNIISKKSTGGTSGAGNKSAEYWESRISSIIQASLQPLINVMQRQAELLEDQSRLLDKQVEMHQRVAEKQAELMTILTRRIR